MQDRKKLSRLALAALLAGAVTAPAATAMPIHGHYMDKAYAPKSAEMDMHASTVRPQTAPKQDYRTESAIERSSGVGVHPRGTMPDLRSENAKEPQPPVGLPTWPVNPEPLAPVSSEPVIVDGDGGDIEWPIAVIALAGALALGGGIGVAGRRLRTQAGPAH